MSRRPGAVDGPRRSVVTATTPHYNPDQWRLAIVGVHGWDDMPASYKPLQVPVAVALGRYEQLTDAELIEHRDDILAEINRRIDNKKEDA